MKNRGGRMFWRCLIFMKKIYIFSKKVCTFALICGMIERMARKAILESRDCVLRAKVSLGGYHF